MDSKKDTVTFSEKEIDKLMNALISSCVDTSRQLQDKLYKLLLEHKYDEK